MDGWEITGPPPGSATNPNDWVRTTAAGFPEGAVVATPHSVYAGFGLEGVTDEEMRATLMDRVIGYLLGDGSPTLVRPEPHGSFKTPTVARTG